MLRAALKLSAKVDPFVLVYWPLDDAVSIVSKKTIQSPDEEKWEKGVICKVKERKSIHEGRIVATGEKSSLKKLEQLFWESELDVGNNIDKGQNNDGEIGRKRKRKDVGEPKKKAKKQAVPKSKPKDSIISVASEQEAGSDGGDSSQMERKDIVTEKDAEYVGGECAEQEAGSDGGDSSQMEREEIVTEKEAECVGGECAEQEAGSDGGDSSQMEREEIVTEKDAEYVGGECAGDSYDIINVQDNSGIISESDPFLLEMNVVELASRLEKVEKRVDMIEELERKLMAVEEKLNRYEEMEMKMHKMEKRLKVLEETPRTMDGEQTVDLENFDPEDNYSPQVPWYESTCTPPVHHRYQVQPLWSSNNVNVRGNSPPPLPPPTVSPYQPYRSRTPSRNQSFQEPPHLQGTTPVVNNLSQAPSCLQIRHHVTNVLPSTVINQNNLLPPSSVLSRYPNLRKESKIGTLAMRLARETYFGEDVMAKCTVMGCRDYPGLPTKELNCLKQFMFSLFPQYWPNPIEFEGLWLRCVDAMGQYSKRRRAEVQKTATYFQWE